MQGPAGSGKTYSALVLAQALGGEVVVIDTERGSSAKFATEWPGFEFDVLDLQPPYDPERYVEAIKFCELEYENIIIDSLSHAWSGTGGALDMVDKKTAAAGGNKYYAWWAGGIVLPKPGNSRSNRQIIGLYLLIPDLAVGQFNLFALRQFEHVKVRV
jgi:hypothetical protein